MRIEYIKILTDLGKEEFNQVAKKALIIKDFMFTVNTTSLTFSELFLLSMVLIFLGLIGVMFSRKNFLIILMSIELMLLGLSLLFLIYSLYYKTIDGQVFVLFILIVAAAEAAAGLALIVIHNRLTKTVLLDNLRNLRG